MEAARIIACMECGGQAHLLTFLPDDEQVPDDMVLAYRCADCWERWDVVSANLDSLIEE